MVQLLKAVCNSYFIVRLFCEDLGVLGCYLMSPAEPFIHLEGSWCPHLQGQAVKEGFDCLILKIMSPHSFEMSGTTRLATQRHIPEQEHC
jgi:hypothetical protein